MGTWKKMLLAAGLVLLLAAAAGCSFQKMAADVVGDAISGEGKAYSSDNDPELVREALPFGLKTYESLLEVTPEHEGLLLASARGFTAYAYLVQREAEELEEKDLARSREMLERARKLYLRGRDYGLRGLEVEYPGFGARVRSETEAALAETTKADVPFLYWTGAAWAGALSAAKDDLELVAELPLAGKLVGRVLALDETFDYGAAHEFFVSYEGGRPGGSRKKAREHYRRAVEISGGRRASVHLALAEAVAVPEQDLGEFRALTAKTLAHDVDRYPRFRLVNVLARERAEWLRSRIPDLFLTTGAEELTQ